MIETMSTEQHGCQYCNHPLDSTALCGVYECPRCLKFFPDAFPVSEVVEARAELELNLEIEKRNHARLRAFDDRMTKEVGELGDVAHDLGLLKDGAIIVRTVTEYLKKQLGGETQMKSNINEVPGG